MITLSQVTSRRGGPPRLRLPLLVLAEISGGPVGLEEGSEWFCSRDTRGMRGMVPPGPRLWQERKVCVCEGRWGGGG